MNKQEPIKVALLGMNERTQSLLDIFFSGRGREHGCVVEEGTANAAIIDMDYPGSEQLWERCHDRDHKPSIVFSVHEQHLPDTVWLPKPINIDELVEATDRLDLLLHSGGIYASSTPAVREAFQPSHQPESGFRSVSWHEWQEKAALREATKPQAETLPPEQPEPKATDLAGKNRWTDPFEERLLRYQAAQEAKAPQRPLSDEKPRESLAFDRREMKPSIPAWRETARVLHERPKPEERLRPFQVRPQAVAVAVSALQPVREEKWTGPVALDRHQVNGATVTWHEAPMVVHEALGITASAAPAIKPEAEDNIRTLEPVVQDLDVQRARSQETEKSRIQDAQHLHEEHFAIEEDFCELMPDVDLSNPEDRESILFSPEAYLLGDVTSALDAARKTHRPVLIEALRERIVFFPESNLLFTTFDPYHLRQICSEPLHRSEVSTHILGDRESVVLEDQISGGKLVNADTFLWSMSIWTSLGRLPRDFDINMPVTLKHWPNLTRLPPTPHAMRIASLWSQRAATLEETAQLLEIPQRCVFVFFNAANALGRLRFVPGAKSQGGLSTHKNRGLFSKLLHKVGKK
ncbi:MAG: hypothetical protein KJ558_01195 [Gammaproteobacteria bacterium]|nr:hypothetical protein [Gammaproteobacteria bacterium]MBU1653451.1 hypothetical protein [Gammaproteobacteria bacterium]MBU1961919.1 hypothetical protein [Gammaproteobacteria bacterium]